MSCWTILDYCEKSSIIRTVDNLKRKNFTTSRSGKRRSTICLYTEDQDTFLMSWQDTLWSKIKRHYFSSGDKKSATIIGFVMSLKSKLESFLFCNLNLCFLTLAISGFCWSNLGPDLLHACARDVDSSRWAHFVNKLEGLFCRASKWSFFETNFWTEFDRSNAINGWIINYLTNLIWNKILHMTYINIFKIHYMNF